MARLGERVSADVEESALLLRCPRGRTGRGRDPCADLDLAARVGVPAHVTVTYPFRPVAALTEADHGRLERLFARVPSFTLTGERTAWFGDEVRLRRGQRGSRRAPPSSRRWPPSSRSTRPTVGVFEEVVPHLTVGHDHDHETLRAAEEVVRARLPFTQPRQPGRAVDRPVAGVGRQQLAARAGLSLG